MQLVVSIAVVLMALAVVTGTQDVTVTEPTLSQKFENFQQRVRNLAGHIGEKTKAAFDDLHRSEFSNRTRTWFENLKEKVRALGNRETN